MTKAYNVVFRYRSDGGVFTYEFLVVSESEEGLRAECASLRAEIAQAGKVGVADVACSPNNQLYPLLLTEAGEREIDWSDVQRCSPSLAQGLNLVQTKEDHCAEGEYFLGYFLRSSDDLVGRNVALIKATDLEDAWRVAKPYLDRLYLGRFGFGIGPLLPVMMEKVAR
jgi:hypothetical protein